MATISSTASFPSSVEIKKDDDERYSLLFNLYDNAQGIHLLRTLDFLDNDDSSLLTF